MIDILNEAVTLKEKINKKKIFFNQIIMTYIFFSMKNKEILFLIFPYIFFSENHHFPSKSIAESIKTKDMPSFHDLRMNRWWFSRKITEIFTEEELGLFLVFLFNDFGSVHSKLRWTSFIDFFFLG